MSELADLLARIRVELPEVADALEILSRAAPYTLTSASQTRANLRFVTPNGSSVQRRGDGIATPETQVVHRRLPGMPASTREERAIVNYQVATRLLHGVIIGSAGGSRYHVLILNDVLTHEADGYLELTYYGDYIAKVLASPSQYMNKAVLASFYQPWDPQVELTIGSNVVVSEHKYGKITTGLTGDGGSGKRVVAESNLGVEYMIVQACCCNCSDDPPPPPPPPPPDS